MFPSVDQASALSVDDFGRDLAGTQALQRKQEDLDKDMIALYQQIQVLQCHPLLVNESETKKFSSNYTCISGNVIEMDKIEN